MNSYDTLLNKIPPAKTYLESRRRIKSKLINNNDLLQKILSNPDLIQMLNKHIRMIWDFAIDPDTLNILLIEKNLKYIKKFTDSKVFDHCPAIARQLLQNLSFIDAFFENRKLSDEILKNVPLQEFLQVNPALIIPFVKDPNLVNYMNETNIDALKNNKELADKVYIANTPSTIFSHNQKPQQLVEDSIDSDPKKGDKNQKQSTLFSSSTNLQVNGDKDSNEYMKFNGSYLTYQDYINNIIKKKFPQRENEFQKCIVCCKGAKTDTESILYHSKCYKWLHYECFVHRLLENALQCDSDMDLYLK